ncbi:hypothetical protein CBR_g19786 [Chara braunii]|uniref:Uncharacterized protein n=1 Tax=Chara braunii TaxID=69332 RepID=A0A388JTX2_CHABU|nr:hypothetical protein CBR_g19786 [Chara braunii]|eukprot:GBG61254.1 hypothetical protein CBR_g19786 [Chara braunii]
MRLFCRPSPILAPFVSSRQVSGTVAPVCRRSCRARVCWFRKEQHTFVDSGGSLDLPYPLTQALPVLSVFLFPTALAGGLSSISLGNTKCGTVIESASQWLHSE